MGDAHAFGLAVANDVEQSVPIGVVTENEPAINPAPTLATSDRHPSGGKCRFHAILAGEPSNPRSPGGGGWAHDDASALQFGGGVAARADGLRQFDTCRPVHLGRTNQRTMNPDGSDVGIQPRQQPLRFPHRIGHDHAGAFLVGVGGPPIVDLRQHGLGFRPMVDRETERTFNDEHVTRHRFKRFGGGVIIVFAIAGDHPDRSTIERLDANLRGAHDVSGGMQADHHLTELMLRAPLEREEVLFWSVSGSNQIGGPGSAHILIATGWGMVGVGVGGDRPGDRTAWVDEKTTTFAIEPFGGGHQEISWDGSGRGHRSEPILEAMEQQHARYWRRVLRLTGVLLGVWFVAGLGAGVLFKEQLDAITIPGTGFPLGFWMAQQGSILVFVLIIWGYARKMRGLDRDAGVEEDDQ